jgi:alkylhydroperoxidase family enzyme
MKNQAFAHEGGHIPEGAIDPMARLPFPDPAAVPEPAARQVDRFPLNLTRMLLYAPDAIGPYIDMGFALLKRGRLDPKLRELVILRVAALSGSAYERTQHLPAALRAGATAAEIASADSGHPAGLDPDIALAFRFAEECARDVKVSDATVLEAKGRFSPPEIAELTLLVGFYMMTARFLETLRVDVDPPLDTTHLG